MIDITTALIIIAAVLLFVAIILIHEFGHFVVAKACGIRVNEFAIGMGPKIFQKQGKETLFTIRLLPIGGFCAMEGEDEDSEDPRAFRNKKVWQRILVVAAGAVFNIVLGFLLVGLLTVQETQYASTEISAFHQEAVSNSENGFQVGDKITKIEGYNVYCARDLGFGLQINAGKPMDFEVIRNGEKIELKDVQFETYEDEQAGTVTTIDFYVQPIKANLFTGIKETYNNTVSMVRMTYKSLFQMVTGQFSMNEIAGPVGITSMIGEVASESFKVSFLTGINSILNIMSLITINLGIMNLLPIPALDGGRIFFLIVEGIRRKPIKNEHWVHAAGMALLMVFVVVVAFNDIIRLFKG